MEAGISAVLGVVMRKSLCRLEELRELLVGLASLIVSVFQFSGAAFRPSRAIHDGGGYPAASRIGAFV
ncbi:hypothetical protein QJS10_CPA03g01008 [Acorus calamus]|uniref:Uncharacterized protein n=1 Tax=Acorus calamus TaxID=4465 RepID=A0AAV9F3X5_ACOCL|nr:hypothetical protein QJS10_CPA03g01008 [Acorus calamus]